MTKYKNYILYILASILLIRILQYSWVTDDAFITFRSVINVVAGNGPVFNIGERVQSFTHPLWFLLLSIGGLLDLNLYFFSILLGLLFSALSILSLFKLRAAILGSHTMLALALASLAASESFVSFSTSGLENSLTFLLIINVIIAALRPAERLKLYTLASLALLNRFDSIFVLTPIIALILYFDARDKKFRMLDFVVGSAPLLAWHTFSLIYYGFLFPNTKYAKVGGRSIDKNAISGINYIFDSLQAEWHFAVLLFLIFLAIAFLACRRGPQPWIIQKPIAMALVAGIALHLSYVIFVAGGDFMRGRFLTNIFLVSSIFLLFIQLTLSKILIFRPMFFSFVGVIAGVLLSVSAWIGAKEHIHKFSYGVDNERNYYKDTLGLNLDPYKSYVYHPWAMQARELPRNNLGVFGVTGQRAYWIPVATNLIDPVALTDAFIARLPVSDSSRTGHFQYNIPPEYILIKVNRQNVLNWGDAKAERLYENIKIVTESPELFSRSRLKSMIWLWLNYGV